MEHNRVMYAHGAVAECQVGTRTSLCIAADARALTCGRTVRGHGVDICEVATNTA